MLIGGAQAQAPTIFQIQTKCYSVVEKDFQMVGKRMTFKPIEGGSVAFWESFEEEKVLRQPSIKLVTAPILRTLEGRQAFMTYKTAAKDTPSTQFTLGYLASAKPQGKIGLEIKFLETEGDEKKERWSYTASTVIGSESQAFVITRNKVTSLYVVSASIVEPPKN